MGIAEKLVSAKESYWISEEVPESEVKATVELAKISAQIERSRLEKGMTQQEFAKYMGVSQGMISKWESREYNFTIKTLNEICEKINLELTIDLQKKCNDSDYSVVKWNSEKVKKEGWTLSVSDEEAIA